MMRVGLLGASRIAPKAMIAPIVKRGDIEIVALACRDMERGQDYVKEHDLGGIDVHGDYAELCARDDIDFVYNALPPSLHLEIARVAARDDRIQLIEKPFAMNADQAREIATLPGLIMEGFHYLFHPAYQAFDVAVQELGKIHKIIGRFHVTNSNKPGELRHIAELGGGALMDLGCYPLHMARQIAGREPRIISANAIEGSPHVDVQLEAQLDFGDGLMAEISCDMREGIERVGYIEAHGEGGIVRLDNPVHPYRGFTLNTPDGNLTLDDRPAWASITTYDAQLDAILTKFHTGKTMPLSHKDAVNNMIAIDAIYTATGLGPR